MILTRLLPLAIAITTVTAQYDNSTSSSDDDLPPSSSGSDDDQSPPTDSGPLPVLPTPIDAGWFDGEYLNYELWFSKDIAPPGYQATLVSGTPNGFTFTEGNATVNGEPVTGDDAIQITDTGIILSLPPTTGNQSVDFTARAPLPEGEFGVGNNYTATFVAAFQNDTTTGEEEEGDDTTGLRKRADVVDGTIVDGVFYRTFNIVVIIDWSKWTNDTVTTPPGPTTPTPPAPGNDTTTTEYGWSTVTTTISNVVTVYTTWCPITTYTKSKTDLTYTKTKIVHTVTTDEAGRETTIYRTETETEAVTFTKDHPKGTTIIVTPTKAPEDDDTTKTTVVQHTSVVSTVPRVSTFDNLGNSVVAGAVGVFVPLFFLLV